MSEFYARVVLPAPDNVSVPDFLFNSNHEIRSARPPNTPCLIDEVTGNSIYMEELKSQTEFLARALRNLYEIGDRDAVSILTLNHADFPASIWAVQILGGVPSPSNPSSTSKEYAYQLDILLPKLIFVHHSLVKIAIAALDTVESARMPLKNIVILGSAKGSQSLTGFTTFDDLVSYGRGQRSIEWRKFRAGEARTAPAFLCWSSGTTGNPKAVEITHFNVTTQIVMFSSHWQHPELPPAERPVRPGDVVSGVLPWYHIYGLVVGLHLPVFSGMSAIITPKFNFEEMLRSISRYRISQLLLVPPQVVLFCKHPAVKTYDLSSVRHIIMAAAPLTSELTLKMAEIFPHAHQGQGYGMTETCAGAALFTVGMENTHGSSGRLLPGTIARVVKSDGTLAKYNEAGELWLKGPQNAAGYWKNEAGTKEVFVDGWVRTGDEVLFKDNGELYVTGRIKEIMKVKGFQVAPGEIEGHLLGHVDVADAAVVGTPDEYAGEVPMAFIVLHEAARMKAEESPEQAEALKAGLAKHVADHKSPYKRLAGGVYFIDVIPRNPSGKILRRVLTEQAREVKAKESRVAAKL